MNKTLEWLTDSSMAGIRLDAAVTQKHPGISRNVVQEMIKASEITVDDKQAKPGLKLKGGEKITLRPRSDTPPATIAATLLDFPIIFEDENIIVIDKPGNLVVHPGAGRESRSVVSCLLSRGSLSPIGAPLRPGVVHRLDKETSGIMVLAKTETAHKALAAAFSSRKTAKEYLAIVQGRPNALKGRIEIAIERDRVQRKQMKATAPDRGKMALTSYEVIEKLNNASFVRLHIETGRTHQIRVHMAYIGHPLLGDHKYGASRDPRFASHFLHSASLAFPHPITGKILRFNSLPPAEFLHTLEQLRKVCASM